MKEERIKGRRYYYITKSDLGYQIYRVKENENWTTNMEWLQRNSYTLNRSFARTFYNLTDASSAFTLARTQWDKRTSTTSTKKSESEDGIEKKSWQEL